jgi:hypothetical protein
MQPGTDVAAGPAFISATRETRYARGLSGSCRNAQSWRRLSPHHCIVRAPKTFLFRRSCR